MVARGISNLWASCFFVNFCFLSLLALTLARPHTDVPASVFNSSRCSTRDPCSSSPSYVTYTRWNTIQLCRHLRQPHLHLILSSAVLHATCADHLLQAASTPKPHPHNEAVMSLNRSLSLDGCRDDHQRICMRTLPSLGALESVVALRGPSLSALHPASIAAISGIIRRVIGHDDLRRQVRFC